MKFTKMEGLGNDFIVLEEMVDADTVRSLADRRRGVGADGVLVMSADLVMRYLNADGSEAEMCGNGLRCLARRAVDRGWAPRGEWFEIETPVGARRVVAGDEVSVEVGPVDVDGTIVLHDYEFTTASVGNPHAVALVDDPGSVPVADVGARVGTDPFFPRGTNVEFVTVTAPGSLRLRVWERGVGETLACGSGIVVAAAVASGMDEITTVTVPGGTATVAFEEGSGYLTGPVATVFSGEWRGR